MSGIRGAKEISEFISRNYSGKVVEVGAGFISDVANGLKSLDLVVTDLEERSLGKIAVVKDDAFSPKMEIYKGASLIYSIRPPLELQVAIGEIALEVGADVLVRPLWDEVVELPGFSRSLVNLGGAGIYLYKKI
jgi:uncharacterized protein